MNDTNRVVVISGGGSGIGRAAALSFAAQGAKVAICGRTLKKLEGTVEQAQGCSGQVIPFAIDIANAKEVEQFYSKVVERWGCLDVVFAHAGINGVWAPIEELAVDEWQKILDINMSGTFFTLKYAVPHMNKKGGSMIVTSSINGTTKFSDLGSSAYSASKAGLLGLVRLLAVELAPRKIRVNAICPGSIDTSVEEHTELRNVPKSGELGEAPFGGIPLTMGKPGTAEQVAALVTFLAGDGASHITGSAIPIDGGQSLVQ